MVRSYHTVQLLYTVLVVLYTVLVVLYGTIVPIQYTVLVVLYGTVYLREYRICVRIASARDNKFWSAGYRFWSVVARLPSKGVLSCWYPRGPAQPTRTRPCAHVGRARGRAATDGAWPLDP